MISNESVLWVVFSLVILALLALDLGIFHRKSHVISIKEAIIWSLLWILVALAFNVVVYFCHSPEAALAFTAGYIVERSLSLDNLFVFMMIFTYFKVPSIYQYRVLIWGIIAALVLRAIFVISGIALIEKFHWIIYIFGAFLVITGLKMALHKDEEVDIGNNCMLKLCRRFMRTTEQYDGGSFFVRKNGSWFATPLFVVLLVVETSDILFALDSVPAVLAISLDPFVVYTSNVFAILGLRALYFALAGCMLVFHYLNHGITLILIFVGVKMLISGILDIPVSVALGFIAFVLIGSIILSVVIHPDKKNNNEAKEF